MNPNIKAILISITVFFVAYTCVSLLLELYIDNLSPGVLGAISAVIAFLLSPRRQIVLIQSGKHIYLKWLFSKKAIRIK